MTTGDNVGWGVVTVASGDTLSWQMMDPVDFPVVKLPVVTYTGLSGRFEGAFGSEELTITVLNEHYENDPDVPADNPLQPRYLVITQELSGVGTITY